MYENEGTVKTGSKNILSLSVNCCTKFFCNKVTWGSPAGAWLSHSVCRLVIKEFLPDDTKNKLPTSALGTYISTVYCMYWVLSSSNCAMEIQKCMAA